MTVLLILTGENKAPSMSFKDLEKKNLLFRETSLSLTEKVNVAPSLGQLQSASYEYFLIRLIISL